MESGPTILCSDGSFDFANVYIPKRSALTIVHCDMIRFGLGGRGRTVSLEESPIFFPTSSFIHLFVLSFSPLLDVTPGMTRGILVFEEVGSMGFAWCGFSWCDWFMLCGFVVVSVRRVCEVGVWVKRA